MSVIQPYAPHVAEELWERLGHARLWEQPWPVADESQLERETFELVVQVNGKVRDRFEVDVDLPEEELVARATGVAARAGAHRRREGAQDDRRPAQARQLRRRLGSLDEVVTLCASRFAHGSARAHACAAAAARRCRAARRAARARRAAARCIAAAAQVAIPLLRAPRPAACRSAAAKLVVDVAGAVRRPGPARARAGHARSPTRVAAAGGATAKADVDAVNLAAPIADGEQIVVPARGSGAAGASSGAAPSPTAPLDLNTRHARAARRAARHRADDGAEDPRLPPGARLVPLASTSSTPCRASARGGIAQLKGLVLP